MGRLVELSFHCWKNNDTVWTRFDDDGYTVKEKITLSKEEYLKRRKEEEAKRMECYQKRYRNFKPRQNDRKNKDSIGNE
jgi:hypothetical protein